MGFSGVEKDYDWMPFFRQLNVIGQSVFTAIGF